MNAITVRNAQLNLAKIVQSVADDNYPTLLIDENDNSAVLVSLEMFNGWQETNHLLSSAANSKHLSESISSYKAGNIVAVSLDDLKEHEE